MKNRRSSGRKDEMPLGPQKCDCQSIDWVDSFLWLHLFAQMSEDVSLVHRFGLEMHEFLDGCMMEMDAYHDILHPNCKAFNSAADVYMKARERVVKHAIKKGIIKETSPPLEMMGAIGTVAGGEPAHGVVVGWEALDHYLDRFQLLD